MSKTWTCRPSEILCIKNDVRAYCLDRAVYLFGMAYDADITDASTPPKGSKGKHNPEQMVALANARWMNDNDAAKEDTSEFEVVPNAKYRDPAVRFTSG